MSIGTRTTVCPGHSRPISEIHFSEHTRDGLFLISGCLDKLPMLRDGITGDWIGTFAGHNGAVWSAKLNAEATRAATGSADFSAKVWDATTGNALHTFDHPHVVKSVAFSKSGSFLSTACFDKKIRVFDLAKPEVAPIVATLDKKPRVCIWSAIGSSSSSTQGPEQQLLTAGDDATIRVWDLRANTKDSVQSLELNAPISDVELSQDKSTYTVCAGQEVIFLDAHTLAEKQRHKFEQEIETATLHPTTPDTFVVGGGDLWVHVHDYSTGKELNTLKGHHGPVHCVRFSPDGKTYASGSEDGTIRLWPFSATSAQSTKDDCTSDQMTSSSQQANVVSA